jgi:acyl carrier protein
VARPDTRTPEQRVREVVAQQLGQEVHRATPEMKLTDLGADDLDKVEIVMALEDEFDAKISEEDAARFTTMGDLLTWAAARKSKP